MCIYTFKKNKRMYRTLTKIKKKYNVDTYNTIYFDKQKSNIM